MSAIFPKARDTFAPFLDTADHAVAQDLQDAYDAAIAIENELGVNPSGSLGSIFSRIFRSISRTTGFWRKYHNSVEMMRGVDLARGAVTQATAVWRGHLMDGGATVYGDNVPAVFVAYQPRDLSSGVVRVFRPWRCWAAILRGDRAQVVALDGDGRNGPDAGPHPIGVLAWNLVT